jgi:hypothetical protein
LPPLDARMPATNHAVDALVVEDVDAKWSVNQHKVRGLLKRPLSSSVTPINKAGRMENSSFVYPPFFAYFRLILQAAALMRPGQ